MSQPFHGGNESSNLSGDVGTYATAPEARNRYVTSPRPPRKINGKERSESAIYRGMVARCTRPNAKDWRYYGARGIRVCERWLGPDGWPNFFADMGERPPGGTLDRIDSDGDYSPANCRWLSIAAQQRNRRDNRLVTIDGVTRCAAEWAELVGMRRQDVIKRLNRGWSDREAVYGRAG
jgi:hypothetical protein